MKLLSATVLAVSLCAACTTRDKSISERLTAAFEGSTSEPIDMAKIGPRDSERLCVLGPYTTNDAAEQILGFKWNVESKSEITTNDHINLLVFVKEQEVLAYSEHRRDKGDFLNLQPRCLALTQATLIRQKDPGGLVQLVLK